MTLLASGILLDVTVRNTSYPTLNPNDELTSKLAGTTEGHPVYVAIMGTVFDVSGNKAYAPGAGYHGTRPPNTALPP